MSMKRSVFSGRRRERFGNPSNPWVRKFMCLCDLERMGDWGDQVAVCAKWCLGSCSRTWSWRRQLGRAWIDVLLSSNDLQESDRVHCKRARGDRRSTGFFLRRSTSTSHQGRHCPAFYLKIPLIPIGATLSLNADVASSRAKVSMLSWHSISHFSSLFLRNTRCYTWRSHSVVLART